MDYHLFSPCPKQPDRSLEIEIFSHAVFDMYDSSTVQAYNDHASHFADQYEKLSTEGVFPGIRALLPQITPTALDVGGGSGRDAAWLVNQGYEVIVVEPAERLAEIGKAVHPEDEIRWVSDHLPKLQRICERGYRFNLILLDGVWMHVPELDRTTAFDTLAGLLVPDGRILFSLRHGPAPADRAMYPVSVEELRALGERQLAEVEHLGDLEDQKGNRSAHWEYASVTLPGGYQRALAKLREIIVNGAKSSTYKLGVIHCVNRLATDRPELARSLDEFTVELPFGHIALEWVRTYRGLLSEGQPQNPLNSQMNLPDIASKELEVGASFVGEQALAVRQALIQARRLMLKYPLRHLTDPEQPARRLFEPCSTHQVPRVADPFALTEDLLLQFGQLHTSKDLWDSLRKHGALVERGLLREWVRLSSDYGRVSS